ncbi:hypothetical protein J6590_006509 [Homalodisca vitripennis]|nr:hypothetical protein J6590_006509 [Homalodisca vitripennis]
MESRESRFSRRTAGVILLSVRRGHNLQVNISVLAVVRAACHAGLLQIFYCRFVEDTICSRESRLSRQTAEDILLSVRRGHNLQVNISVLAVTKAACHAGLLKTFYCRFVEDTICSRESRLSRRTAADILLSVRRGHNLQVNISVLAVTKAACHAGLLQTFYCRLVNISVLAVTKAACHAGLLQTFYCRLVQDTICRAACHAGSRRQRGGRLRGSNDRHCVSAWSCIHLTAQHWPVNNQTVHPNPTPGICEPNFGCVSQQMQT